MSLFSHSGKFILTRARQVRTLLSVAESEEKTVLRKCSSSTAAQSVRPRVITETGNVSPLRSVPDHITRPPYIQKGRFLAGLLDKLSSKQKDIEIKDEKQIEDCFRQAISCQKYPIQQCDRPTEGTKKRGDFECHTLLLLCHCTARHHSGMRAACHVARTVLDRAAAAVRPGVTTDQLDIIVHDYCTQQYSAYPSTLCYKNFPKSVCTSVNNVACHGIPDDRPLADGDIINIDVTVYYNGYHGDVSETYLVGDVDDAGRRLAKNAQQCRDEAISICAPGVPFHYLGNIIEYTAQAAGYQVIPNLCGHGIGNYFHGPPDIYHFANDAPGEMREGMTFTIEPILTEGDPAISILADGWTAVTVDHSRSAQFEHTILITSDGHEVLTRGQLESSQ